MKISPKVWIFNLSKSKRLKVIEISFGNKHNYKDNVMCEIYTTHVNKLSDENFKKIYAFSIPSHMIIKLGKDLEKKRMEFEKDDC